MNDPYLDIDWAIALQDSEMSHVLWLSNEELKTSKLKAKQRGRNIKRNLVRNESYQKVA